MPLCAATSQLRMISNGQLLIGLVMVFAYIHTQAADGQYVINRPAYSYPSRAVQYSRIPYPIRQPVSFPFPAPRYPMVYRPPVAPLRVPSYIPIQPRTSSPRMNSTVVRSNVTSSTEVEIMEVSSTVSPVTNVTLVDSNLNSTSSSASTSVSTSTTTSDMEATESPVVSTAAPTAAVNASVSE